MVSPDPSDPVGLVGLLVGAPSLSWSSIVNLFNPDPDASGWKGLLIVLDLITLSED
jgi:hypothetical protein